MNTVNAQTQSNSAAAVHAVCFDFCNQIVPGLRRAKEEILSEYRHSLIGRNHMAELALNEAEALAWETDFPHLIFPTLGLEKVSKIAAWQTQQRKLRTQTARMTDLAFAA